GVPWLLDGADRNRRDGDVVSDPRNATVQAVHELLHFHDHGRRRERAAGVVDIVRSELKLNSLVAAGEIAVDDRGDAIELIRGIPVLVSGARYSSHETEGAAAVADGLNALQRNV